MSFQIEKTFAAVRWLKNFINLRGDLHPAKEAIHLPHVLTKTYIYILYTQGQGGREPGCVSFSWFRYIWKKHFSHVTIPKVCITYEFHNLLAVYWWHI